MPYNTFSIKQIQRDFGLKIVDDQEIFGEIPEVEASDLLKEFLAKNQPLAEAIGTEKAKSEFIIAPILSEIRDLTDREISLFSGIEFNVDESKGLNGRCDYIISASPVQFSLTAPIMTMVEAKNDNINSGLGQCMAEMLAASIYNEQEGNPTNAIYGCVSNGSIWRFLKLEKQIIYIDTKQYFIDSLNQLLGVLVYISSNVVLS